MKTYDLIAVATLLTFAIGSGWVKNIAKLSDLDFEPGYKAEIIRVVSLFPPVGMITGWMDIGEENDAE